MRQRFARVLPVARRGGDPDPETAPGGAIGARAGQDAAVRRSRSHHRLRRQHAAAGLHQRNPDQPNLEQGFYSAAGQPGLALALSRARALSRPREGGTHNHQFRFCEGWSRSECNNTHRWLWAPAFARATNQVECAMMARPTFSSSLFAPRNDGLTSWEIVEQIQQICPTGKSLRIFRSRVKPLLQKYFASLPTQISSLIRTVSFRQEGRIARRHETPDGMRWTLAARETSAACWRTAKSCRSDAPMLASSLR